VPTKGLSKLYDVPYLEENGSNFAFWKYRVKMVLKIQKLWSLVDGTDKAPSTTSTDYSDWVSRDDEAHTQIALTLTDEPLNTIFNAETSKEAWDHLMMQYEGKGEQKIAYLIIELFRSTLSDDMPLNPQINAMLRTANTITTLGLPLHEKLIALAIIILLPPSYDTLKTILTAAKSMEMTVENVHSQVALKEHRRAHEADSSSVFAARFKGTPKGNKDLKANRSCSYCKKPGHKVEDCHKLKAKREKDAATVSVPLDSTALCVQMHSYDDNDPIRLFHAADKLANCSDLTDRWLIDSGVS